MQKEAGITLNIENTNPVSYCEMEVDGTAQEKITVPPGAKSTLSFLDCPSKDLLLTVTKTIGAVKIWCYSFFFYLDNLWRERKLLSLILCFCCLKLP